VIFGVTFLSVVRLEDNEDSPLGMRREDTVIEHLVCAWLGDERHELFQKFERLENDVGGAVAKPTLHLVEDFSIGLAQPLLRERWAQNVTGQSFELLAFGGLDSEIRMQIESRDIGGALGFAGLHRSIGEQALMELAGIFAKADSAAR